MNKTAEEYEVGLHGYWGVGEGLHAVGVCCLLDCEQGTPCVCFGSRDLKMSGGLIFLSL